MHGFWPLLLIAFVGTLNPSGGDVSVFLPLEHTVLAQTAADEDRTAMFARYSFVGAIVRRGRSARGRSGRLACAAPLAGDRRSTLMFVLYGVLGLLTLLLYRGLSPAVEPGDGQPSGAARPVAAAGLRARRPVRARCLRRRTRRQRAPGALALRAFRPVASRPPARSSSSTKLCSAVSYFLAVPLADRFGLVNTMVFTHLPANVFLMLTAFAPTHRARLRAARSSEACSREMDVPTRSSYVMAVVSAGGAAGGGEPDRRAAQSGLGACAAPLRLALHADPVRVAARHRGRAQGRAYDLALLLQFSKMWPPEEACDYAATLGQSRRLSGAGGRHDSALARCTAADRTRVLVGRSLRAFADGYVAILLPVHLSRLGFEAFAVGAISTAALLGSALLTLALGMSAHRVRRRPALLGAALLMAATGFGFAGRARILAAPADRLCRHAEPVGRRRQRVPPA